MKISPVVAVANTRRIALEIVFQCSDFNEFCDDYPDKAFLELYENFHEFKTNFVHDFITRPPYEDKIILLSVCDEVYELNCNLLIDATKHHHDRNHCTFCTLEFDLEC